MASCHRLYLCSPSVAPSLLNEYDGQPSSLYLSAGVEQTPVNGLHFPTPLPGFPVTSFGQQKGSFQCLGGVHFSPLCSCPLPWGHDGPDGSCSCSLHPRIKRHTDLKRGLIKIKLIYRLGVKKILLPMNIKPAQQPVPCLELLFLLYTGTRPKSLESRLHEGRDTSTAPWCPGLCLHTSRCSRTYGSMKVIISAEINQKLARILNFLPYHIVKTLQA